jgi:D-3-phosphoglycerate dehydrogenase
MQILISDQNFGDDARLEREVAEKAGVEVAVANCRDEDDVVDALERHRPDVLLVQFAPVGRRALASAQGRLGAVVRYGVGVDNVDLVAATELGIAVARIPDYCLDEVADHTLALVLAVERGIVPLARDVEAGGWSFRAAGVVRRLRGRTFGLLGFGQVARRVASRAAGFGYRVLAHDPALPADDVRAGGAEPRALDELLGEADVLSVHAPLTDATRGLLDARALELLHQGAIVVNTARGGIVDESALVEAVARGRLRGAALDVLEQEPPGLDDPLRRTPGILLTSHSAWYSQEAIVDLRRKAIETALALARGEQPTGLVSA